MLFNLNNDEIRILEEQQINELDKLFLNENIDIFYKYTKYTEIFENTGKIQDAIDAIKKDFDRIDNSTKTIKSFDSYNYIKLPDNVKSLNFEINNIAGIYRKQTFTTYYDFYLELNKLKLNNIISTDLTIKNNKVIFETFTLNLLDIIKIKYKEINNYNAFNLLEKITGAQILESNIIKLNQGVLVSNKRVLNEFDTYVCQQVYSYLKPYIGVMQAFLDQALFHISPITTKSASSIFFVSNRHLADYCNVSKTKINYVINMFASVGMLTKLSEKDIPKKIKQNAQFYANELNKKQGTHSNTNLINFYSWVDFTNSDVIKYIENAVLMLINNKVTVTNITEKTIKNTFGKLIADSVYNNNSTSVRKSVRNRLQNESFKKYSQDWYNYKSTNKNTSFKQFMKTDTV